MDLQTLQQQCLACRRCSLCETRTHVVFGQGAADAEVLFVGEGPGANEDAQGLPFVGRSGQLLDHYLEAVDLSREKNVYIANIVKCRPPQNRDPLPEESAACLPWLRQQAKTSTDGLYTVLLCLCITLQRRGCGPAGAQPTVLPEG